MWADALIRRLYWRYITFTITDETYRGHRQPPLNGLRRNLTLGAGHVNPVDDQAPPNSNALQPCSVVLERIQSPQSNNAYHLVRPRLRPCTINLNDCLINNSHLHKKLRVQNCGSLRCKTCPILDTQTKFRSSLTHREYNTFSPDVVTPLGCK